VIFSVKEWRDLENQVKGRSRSTKMAPFDRPYATVVVVVVTEAADRTNLEDLGK